MLVKKQMEIEEEERNRVTERKNAILAENEVLILLHPRKESEVVEG
jgi:hypothetical protein